MKILFIIDNLSTGGAQRQMVNLAVGLSKRGHAVQFFSYATGDLLAQPLYDTGIKVNQHIKRSRFSTEVIFALRKLVQQEKFDILLSYLPTPNFYAILAGIALVHPKIPVIVSERRCDLPEGPSLTEQLARQFYRLATHVVTNSHHQRIALANKYQWLKDRITTIYNGYDLDIFVPAAKYPNNNPLQILCIASVAPHKNGMCLVEALHILRDNYQLLPKVDWVGQIFSQNQCLKYFNDMKQIINTYHLEDQWNWLKQRTDIVYLIQQHDVLVHPSFGEGLPNAVCEAMACGCPVILSDTLDHAQLIQHDVSGYLFNYEDPNDLAEKLRMYIGLSNQERKMMGQKGRGYAEKNLSLERMTDDYEALFNRVMN